MILPLSKLLLNDINLFSEILMKFESKYKISKPYQIVKHANFAI